MGGYLCVFMFILLYALTRVRPAFFQRRSPQLTGRVFLLRFSTVSMADSSTVYLEDVEVAKSVRDVKPATATPTATTGAKRQRTLVDMFGGASQPKPSAAKKQRLDKSTIVSASASSPDASGSQATDAVPFSIASFQASLSDEQKDLLSLECEVMGESWQVTRLEASKKQLFITVFSKARNAQG